MSFFTSFRFKIFISFWIFGLLLVFVYHIATYFIILSEPVKDAIYKGELKKEFIFLKEQNALFNREYGLNSRLVTTYAKKEHLPESLRAAAGDLGVGYYHLDIPTGKDQTESYYFSIQKRASNGEPVYFIFDHNRYEEEFKTRERERAFDRFRVAFMLVVIFGFFIGLMISHTLIAPLKKLSALIKETEPENLPVNFSRMFKKNEVGILAESLEKAMQRIEGFIKREQYFTRDASHELRTPVTVIKGAVEVIRHNSESISPGFEKVLQRIERSLKSMEVTIETFLWLGREKEMDNNSQTYPATHIVEEVIEENRYLIREKPITVEFTVIENIRIRAPNAVFKITLTNLIRNAFSYTYEGLVRVTVWKNGVEISDTGKGIDPTRLSNITQSYEKGDDSSGFGLGLAIVERLCNKLNWKLEIDSQLNLGTRATIIIPPENHNGSEKPEQGEYLQQ